MKCLKLCLPLDSSLLQFRLMAGNFIVDINYGLLNFAVFSDVRKTPYCELCVVFM